jgi:hypothetical protein
MKKGAISAHEAVLALSRTLGETFGGDAFLTASKGLNAEWGRLNTTWTLLTENIYRASESILKGFVKDVTSITDSFVKWTGNTTELNKVISTTLSILTGLAVGGLVITLGVAFNKLATAIAAASAAGTIFNGVLAIMERHPVILGLTAVAGVGSFFYAQAKATEAATLSMKDYNRQLEIEFGYRKQSAAEKVKQSIAENSEYKAAKDQESKARKEYINLIGTSGIDRNDPRLIAAQKAITLAISKQIKVEQQASAEIKEIRQQTALDLESIENYRADIMKKSTDKQISYQGRLKEFYLKETNQKALANYMQVFSEAVSSGDTKKQQEALDAIDNYKKAAESAATSTTNTVSAANQAFKTQMNELKLDAKEQVAIISDLLNTLEEDYSNNLVSIKSYYDQKRNLQETAYRVEQETLKEEIAAAAAKGDNVKVLELKRKAVELEIKFGKENTATIREQIAAEREYAAAKAQSAMNVAAFKGGTGLSFQALWEQQLIGKSDEIAKAMAQNDIGYAMDLEAEAKHNAAMAKTEQHLNRINRLEDIHRIGLEQIQIELDNGNLSRQDALNAEIKLQNAQLQGFASEIENLKEIAKENKDDLLVQEKLTEAILRRSRILADIAKQEKAYRDQDIQKVIPGYGGLDDSLNRLDFNKKAYAAKMSDLNSRSGNAFAIESDLRTAKENALPGTDLSMYDDLIQIQVEKHKGLNKEKASIDKQYTASTIAGYAGMFGAIAGMGADAFMQMTKSAVQMYGAQSKEAQKAFKMYKAMRIAEATMAGAQAVIAQLANPTPYVGIALAAVAAAMTAYQIAQISAQQMPQAHAGLDYVPENNQTYLLSKGERVLAPQQNKDLTNYLKERNMGVTTQNKNVNNVKIVNSFDSSILDDYLASEQGERVILNVIQKAGVY